MAKLTAKRRNALPGSSFGMPGERKYPMPDKGHAANAKARASQQRAKGNISASQEASIDAKANSILHHGKTRSGRHSFGNISHGNHRGKMGEA